MMRYQNRQGWENNPDDYDRERNEAYRNEGFRNESFRNEGYEREDQPRTWGRTRPEEQRYGSYSQPQGGYGQSGFPPRGGGYGRSSGRYESGRYEQEGPERFPSYGQSGFGGQSGMGQGGYGTGGMTGWGGTESFQSGEGWGGTSGYRGSHGPGTQQLTRQGRFTGRGPKGYKRTDERIEEDVNEQLTIDGELDAENIEVKVQNGVVTLNGTVENRQAKRDAEDLAESVFGVKDVENRIRVQPTSMQNRETGTRGYSEPTGSTGQTTGQQTGSQQKESETRGRNPARV